MLLAHRHVPVQTLRGALLAAHVAGRADLSSARRQIPEVAAALALVVERMLVSEEYLAAQVARPYFRVRATDLVTPVEVRRE